jgi:hypothetical protein
MHFYLRNISILLTLTLFISACTPLFDGREAQYSHSKQIESNEIKKAYTTFNSMQGIDVVLHVNKSDLSSYVNKSFEHFSTNFDELHAGEFSNVSFEELKLNLGTQQMVSELGFTFYIDALKRKIHGHIMAKHSFEVGRDKFVLSTNFDEIVIDKMENNIALEQSEENRHLVSSSVKSFMHTLNMEIKNSPLSIPVDLNILKDINGKDIVSSPDYKLHSAKPVYILTKMKAYMPYIYEGGVVFLGASEVKKSKGSVKEGARSLWSDFKSKIDLELDRSMGISLDSLQEDTSYYVSKSYLSKQMNSTLKNIDLRSINKSFLHIKEKDRAFSKDIYFSEEYRKTLQSCERRCDVNYGIHKCEDCAALNNPFEKERCISRQESCKTREEFKLYECSKHEEMCRIEKDERRKVCEIENRSLIAQCQNKKNKLLFVNDEIILARLNLSLDVVNSYAVQRIRTMEFDQNMEKLEVFRDLHVSMDTRLKLGIVNNIDSDINCSTNIHEPLFTHSQSDYVGMKRRLSLVTQTLSNGYMIIKGASKPYMMKVQFNKTPYENFISNDELLLSCRFMNVPLPSLTKREFLNEKEVSKELSAVVGEIELKFDEEELSFVISPAKLATDTVLFPTMGSKAVVFSK